MMITRFVGLHISYSQTWKCAQCTVPTSPSPDRPPSPRVMHAADTACYIHTIFEYSMLNAQCSVLSAMIVTNNRKSSNLEQQPTATNEWMERRECENTNINMRNIYAIEGMIDRHAWLLVDNITI